jgi:glutamate-1-semialdehyde 2,1-aminomutase
VDVETGVGFNANAGSTIWLPKGSRSILRSCKNLSAFYVEQDCRPPSALEVEDTLWLQTLAELHSQLLGEYVEANPKSKAVFEEALKYLPGGSTRSVLHFDPFPMAFSSGRSCYVTSKDNREYLDCVSEYSAAMFGHSHPEILSAIQKATSSGINLGGPGEGEVELAKQIVSRFHSIDKVRFCNSGTEANMMALQLAQFVTGRSKVFCIPH